MNFSLQSDLVKPSVICLLLVIKGKGSSKLFNK